MKTKRLLFISCLAAGALIASPSFGKPAKKSAGMSQSKATRVVPHTTQVMRHTQNISPRTGGTRYYGGTRYTGTRSYAVRQYSGTRYYNYYSYYRPTYGYNGSIVASVQQRLGRLGYYHGVADGVMGPQTRSAIAAFESRNGMTVDGTISRPLLDTLGLA
jgi:hypothetical protein